MSRGIRISEKHGVNASLVNCFWCGKDKGEIALLGKMKATHNDPDPKAPMHIVLDYEPCKECADTMAKEITIIEVSMKPEWKGQPVFTKDRGTDLYPVGAFTVITEEAAKRLFEAIEMSSKGIEQMLKMRKVLVFKGFIQNVTMRNCKQEDCGGMADESQGISEGIKDLHL